MKFLDVQIVERQIKTIHGEFEMKIQDMVRESEIICFKTNQLLHYIRWDFLFLLG